MSAQTGVRTATDVIAALKVIAHDWALAGRDHASVALEDALEELDRRIEDGRA